MPVPEVSSPSLLVFKCKVFGAAVSKRIGFPVGGAWGPLNLMEFFFRNAVISIIRALEDNLVVMSLLSADPFFRLSVHVGAT